MQEYLDVSTKFELCLNKIFFEGLKRYTSWPSIIFMEEIIWEIGKKSQRGGKMRDGRGARGKVCREKIFLRKDVLMEKR